jgi:hypothetical protein
LGKLLEYKQPLPHFSTAYPGMGQIDTTGVVPPSLAEGVGIAEAIANMPAGSAGTNLGFTDALSLWLSSPATAWGFIGEPSVLFSYGTGFGLGMFAPIVVAAMVGYKMMQRR